MSSEDKKTKKLCSSCYYSDPSFNFLHCRKHHDRRGATETCDSWYAGSKRCFRCKKMSNECICRNFKDKED